MFKNCFVFIIKFKKVHKKVNIVCFFIFLCYIKNMKNVLLKISKGFLNVVLVILFLLSLASAGLVAASFFVADLSEISFAYAFIGEFIYPIEFLINTEIGKVQMGQMNIIMIWAGVAIAILCILAIIEFRKICKKNSEGEKKNSGVKTGIFSLLTLAYSALNVYYLLTQFMVLKRFLNKNLTGIPKDLLKEIGMEPVLFKGMAICGLIALFSFIIFVLNFFDRNPASVRAKKKEGRNKSEINFYSEGLIENQQKQIENVQLSAENSADVVMKSNKKQAEDLVTKVMQLNKLRDAGQLTEVEYTKLRQKAIRRYKG